MKKFENFAGAPIPTTSANHLTTYIKCKNCGCVDTEFGTHKVNCCHSCSSCDLNIIDEYEYYDYVRKHTDDEEWDEISKYREIHNDYLVDLTAPKREVFN